MRLWGINFSYFSKIKCREQVVLNQALVSWCCPVSGTILLNTKMPVFSLANNISNSSAFSDIVFTVLMTDISYDIAKNMMLC